MLHLSASLWRQIGCFCGKPATPGASVEQHLCRRQERHEKSVHPDHLEAVTPEIKINVTNDDRLHVEDIPLDVRQGLFGFIPRRDRDALPRRPTGWIPAPVDPGDVFYPLFRLG